MVRFFPFRFLDFPRRVNAIILALTLLSGYFLGALCSLVSDLYIFSQMRSAALSQVSIVSLIPVLLLPFLCSAFAVYIGQLWLLIPIAFSKSFLFSFLCSGICSVFTESGQLFSMLFLCADTLLLPVLCWYWLRCTQRNDTSMRTGKVTFLLILGIGYLDYQVISPFLVKLLS